MESKNNPDLTSRTSLMQTPLARLKSESSHDSLRMSDTNPHRFDEKLGRIVVEEEEGNFISRLHRGDIVIVPWPMMSSPAFYHTFEDIKKLLLDRPVVHSTGGEFLGVLKMLMAQIQVKFSCRKILDLTCLKASDWRAIESETIHHECSRFKVFDRQSGISTCHNIIESSVQCLKIWQNRFVGQRTHGANITCA
jgi:hypothetical protein